MTNSSAGIAGKDFGEIRGLWPETVITFLTADLLQWLAGRKKGLLPQEDSLVALAGRHVKWTSLAVQQQRFETDSNADQTNPDALASLHLLALHLQQIDKEHFDNRDS